MRLFQIAGMFIIHLVSCRYIAYSVVALLAEINTVFLHFRKLLQMSGIAFSHPLYRANAAVNLLSFVGCRFVCLVWIAYGMIAWRARVSGPYLVAISSAVTVMYVINVVLFWRLLCSDVLGRRRSRPPLESPVTAYRVIADSTVPVSAEDVCLACCHLTDSVSPVGRPTADRFVILRSAGDGIAAPKASPPFHDVADHVSLVLRSHAPPPAVW